MMLNKIVVCPICGKKTYLRIQDGGYLDSYPIRINCINCRALIKGNYIMNSQVGVRGLNLYNAIVEDPGDVDIDKFTGEIYVNGVDYVAEVSGELPCNIVKKYSGNEIESPFLRMIDKVKDNPIERIKRLSLFSTNMKDWAKKKIIAFELLDEGSIEYIAVALNNKMGEYNYECDNFLKSLHCIQEVVLEQTQYLFFEQSQDQYINNLLQNLSTIDKSQVHKLIETTGGKEGLIRAYKKTMEVFSDFMSIYPNILPAETYIRYDNNIEDEIGIATCSFSDIKTFYQDAYEALLSLFFIPVGLDNIVLRSTYDAFSDSFNSVNCYGTRDMKWYCKLDNGTRINKICIEEPFQKLVNFPANRMLRNGIGHNNYTYDGITQVVTTYSFKNPEKIDVEKKLIDIAVDCIGLSKSAVILSEIILFLLREECALENIHSIMHPRFYKDSQQNSKCPCGSNLKYKKCCKNDVEKTILAK